MTNSARSDSNLLHQAPKAFTPHCVSLVHLSHTTDILFAVKSRGTVVEIPARCTYKYKCQTTASGGAQLTIGGDRATSNS